MKEVVQRRLDQAYEIYKVTDRDCKTFNVKFAVWWELRSIMEEINKL